MSYIVRGIRNPKACEEWRNGTFKRCPYLTKDDWCRVIGRASRSMTFEEQYYNCPIVSIKRTHGALIDAERLLKALPNADEETVNVILSQEVVLEAEDETWH